MGEKPPSKLVRSFKQRPNEFAAAFYFMSTKIDVLQANTERITRQYIHLLLSDLFTLFTWFI